MRPQADDHWQLVDQHHAGFQKHVPAPWCLELLIAISTGSSSAPVRGVHVVAAIAVSVARPDAPLRAIPPPPEVPVEPLRPTGPPIGGVIGARTLIARLGPTASEWSARPTLVASRVRHQRRPQVAAFRISLSQSRFSGWPCCGLIGFEGPHESDRRAVSHSMLPVGSKDLPVFDERDLRNPGLSKALAISRGTQARENVHPHYGLSQQGVPSPDGRIEHVRIEVIGSGDRDFV